MLPCLFSADTARRDPSGRQEGKNLLQVPVQSVWMSCLSGFHLIRAWASRCVWSKRFTSCRMICRKLCTNSPSSLANSAIACFSSRDTLAGFLRRLQRHFHHVLPRSIKDASLWASLGLDCPAVGGAIFGCPNSLDRMEMVRLQALARIGRPDGFSEAV